MADELSERIVNDIKSNNKNDLSEAFRQIPAHPEALPGIQARLAEVFGENTSREFVKKMILFHKGYIPAAAAADSFQPLMDAWKKATENCAGLAPRYKQYDALGFFTWGDGTKDSVAVSCAVPTTPHNGQGRH